MFWIKKYLRIVGASMLSGVMFVPACLIFSVVGYGLIRGLVSFFGDFEFGNILGLIPYVGDAVGTVDFIKQYAHDIPGALITYGKFFAWLALVVGSICLVCLVPDTIKFWFKEKSDGSQRMRRTSVFFFCLSFVTIITAICLMYHFWMSKILDLFQFDEGPSPTVLHIVILLNMILSVIIYRGMIDDRGEEFEKKEASTDVEMEASDN